MVRTFPFVGSMRLYLWMGWNVRRRSAISVATSSMRAAALPYSRATRHAFFLPAGASHHSRYASATMVRVMTSPCSMSSY